MNLLLKRVNECRPFLWVIRGAHRWRLAGKNASRKKYDHGPVTCVVPVFFFRWVKDRHDILRSFRRGETHFHNFTVVWAARETRADFTYWLPLVQWKSQICLAVLGVAYWNGISAPAVNQRMLREVFFQQSRPKLLASKSRSIISLSSAQRAPKNWYLVL